MAQNEAIQERSNEESGSKPNLTPCPEIVYMQDQAQTPVQQPTSEINIAEAELRMLKDEFARSMQAKEEEIGRKQ